MFANGTAKGRASLKLKNVNPWKYPDYIKLAGKDVEIDITSIKRVGAISSLLVREVGTTKTIPISSLFIETNDPEVLRVLSRI